MRQHNYSTNAPKRVKLALTLAFVWGGLWASFLEFSRPGRWLVNKRTWITVVVGIGVDVLIATITIPFGYVIQFFSILAASSLLIILRSLMNELTETNERNDIGRR